MKELYHYIDYRSYLKDFYEEKKDKNSSYSFQLFSNKAGLSSPSHFRLVMKGERGLSQKTISKFCKGLGLNKKESIFFEKLVYFNQAKELEEKKKYWDELEKLKKIRGTRKVIEAKSLYHEWFYPIIYEYAQTNLFSEQSFGELSKAIGASEAKIKQGLKYLEDAKLLVKNQRGEFQANDYCVRSVDEVESLLVRSFNKKMTEKGIEQFDRPIEDRDLRSLTIAMDDSQKDYIKKRLREFISEMNKELSTSDTKDSVYQLNTQFFKLI